VNKSKNKSVLNRKSFTIPNLLIGMDDELPEAIKKCIKILEENIDILSNIEMDLEDQKEDEIVSNLEIHDLYDMTEDLAESTKLKRAEFNLMRRNAENLPQN